MKYAFNTWCYSSFPSWLPAYPLDTVIDRLADIGYDGIEIGCAAPHAWPDYLDAPSRSAIRERLEARRLAAASLLPAPGGGPGANPASILERERDWTREHYKAVVDLAADLGASRVLYIAGWQISGVTRSQAWAWSLETLKAVAAHAETKGVTICVEPTPADSNLIETPDQALEMMDAAGHSNIKVMFDTFHALYRNEDPVDAVRRMGSHLDHVHMSDHDRLAPGSGGMDFRPVMEALLEAGFEGFVTMEVGFTARSAHPDSIARRSFEHLRGLESQLLGQGR
ncbi:sugar phosphate isomerase/epimerase family protein [Pelagibacterium montanilacus]|uniref:sugar phosphate isomerase/epimerase family protein n=1 Tax=Pelagibacterium montanilacus TaxID=2185280 RepID=UPI000F8F6207|nr:sugar phosphate isomerase/epimerase [Pelagibacterium montanilacus]